VTDLADWLHALGRERYEEAFRENAVSADVLPSLTAEDLRDLGVTAVGDRRRLLDAITKLRNDGGQAGSLSFRDPLAAPANEELWTQVVLRLFPQPLQPGEFDRQRRRGGAGGAGAATHPGDPALLYAERESGIRLRRACVRAAG
jgi:hypothetical protein